MDDTKPANEPAAETPERPIGTPEGAEGEAVQCESCGRTFANRDELQAHAGRRHTHEQQPTTTAS